MEDRRRRVLADRRRCVQVRTPPWSTADAATTVDYRIASSRQVDPSVGVGETDRSSAVRITYENQSAYRGIAATVYDAAKAYCQSAAVHVEDLPPTNAGLYGSGSQLIQIDSSVGVTTETEPIDVRAVAVHECSHERQWMNYGGTGDGRVQMESAAAAIFADFVKPVGETTPYAYWPPEDGRIEPIEHAADCGAQAVNPGGYMGYGGWCSPSQLEAGRRLLLGERY